MRQKEIFIQYNTIDIDTTDKEYVFRILFRILLKGKIRDKCLLDWDMFPSNLKGYHIRLYCKKKCDLCRLVFDDDIRYFYDQYREIESQNVLTQTTEPFILEMKKQ